MGFINDEHEFIHTKYSQSAKPAIGFKLTDDGNYDMENKKIFKLKAQNDVAVDADYDSYVLDMKSGVNKEYLKLNCLTKDDAGNNFDANQSVIHNTEPYYDGLYQKTSLVSKEYVDLMDTNLEQKIQNKADLSTNNEQTFNSIINVPNFDQGYSNMSNVMNKEYIDSRDALKADKSYADDTYLTKAVGGVLAHSIQNKADKSYADKAYLTKAVGGVLAQSIQTKLGINGSKSMQANLNMGGFNITNLKMQGNDSDAVNKLYVDSSHVTSVGEENVFSSITTDSNNQLSEENDIELGNLIDHPSPYHKINKKVVDTKLLFDSVKGYYSSRLGINMYPFAIDYYTMAFELYFPVEIDENSVDIDVVSLIDTVNKVTRRVYEGYSRTIAQIHQQHNNNYLYVDLVLKMKSGHSYVPKLQTYIAIYGIKTYQSNVEPSIYDQIYYIANDQINFNTAINMDNKAIYGVLEGNSDSQAVNYKQLNSFNDNLKTYLETKILSLQPKSYYNKLFEKYFNLTDASKFIMSDSYGAVVSGLNGNLVFHPTKLLADFDPIKGFMGDFIINLNENVTESDGWTIYMTFKYDYKPEDNKRIKIEFVNGSSFDFPWVKVENNKLSLEYDLDLYIEQIRAAYIGKYLNLWYTKIGNQFRIAVCNNAMSIDRTFSGFNINTSSIKISSDYFVTKIGFSKNVYPINGKEYHKIQFLDKTKGVFFE